MTDAENQLRALWTARGVPAEKQDALIAAVKSRATAGTRIGPWTLGSQEDGSGRN
uniref:hypothetical protein n=1 Tax=Ochrobactrum sp. LM19 TaxID=1449781 RepID=UPI0015E7EA6C|nr:hypothetical protein [Ochrobactrum sp. LM19]